MARPAQPRGELIAVHPGQADVENGDVAWPSCIEGQGLRPVVRHRDVVSGASNDVREHVRSVGVVVDDEDVPRAVVVDLQGRPNGLRNLDAHVLWSRRDDNWAVHGLLVESAEPLIRDGGRRMALLGARVGSTDLPVRRFNAAGTRALWLAAQPIPLASDTVVSLTVSDRGAQITRRLTVQPVPRFTIALMAEAVRP